MNYLTRYCTNLYITNWAVPDVFFNSLRQGTSIIDVRVTDQADNITEEIVFYIIKDTLGPEISLIEIETDADSAIISWTTDEAATSQLEWGTTNSLGSLTTETTGYITSHQVTLSELTVGITYYFKCHSDDQSDHETSSSIYVFTIPAAPSEVIDPTEEEIIPTDVTVNDSDLPATSLTNPETIPIVNRQEVTLTGKTSVGATVVISLNGDSATTTADSNGNWSVTFDEISLGQHTASVTITANGTSVETVLGTFLIAHPAATILYPTPDLSVITRKPIIKGLARSGHTVKVYLDGVYNGSATVTTDDSGTGSFAYEPFLNLTYGQHTLHTVTEDVEGNRSDISESIPFSVVYPFITPTLYNPIIDSATPSNITIVGLAKNGSTVYVYLDDGLQSSFVVTDHLSGTASFAYTLSTNNDLATGWHDIYLIATDDNGKLSRRSRIIRFNKPTTTIIDPLDSFSYTVQPGDSLWGIAQKYSKEVVSYTELVLKNRGNYPSLADNPGLIKPGWVLTI